MPLDRRSNTRPKDLDLTLVARLDRERTIFVSSTQNLDALNRRQREDIDPLDLNRILVAFLVDEI